MFKILTFLDPLKNHFFLNHMFDYMIKKIKYAGFNT